jgi:hypothetical protein
MIEVVVVDTRWASQSGRISGFERLAWYGQDHTSTWLERPNPKSLLTLTLQPRSAVLCLALWGTTWACTQYLFIWVWKSLGIRLPLPFTTFLPPIHHSAWSGPGAQYNTINSIELSSFNQSRTLSSSSVVSLWKIRIPSLSNLQVGHPRCGAPRMMTCSTKIHAHNAKATEVEELWLTF